MREGVDADSVVFVRATGRDTELTCRFLDEAGQRCRACASDAEVVRGVDSGEAGMLLIAEERLTEQLLRALAASLAAQPPWSDLPVVVVARSEPAHGRLLALAPLANVSVLLRPMAIENLVSVVRTGLRARRRQLQVRDLLQAQRDEALRKDEFLAMLAHELRNPLAPVLNAVRLLAREPAIGAAGQRALQMIDRQVLQMRRLLNDLLEVSRITRGMIALDCADIALDRLVFETIEAALPGLRDKQQAIRTHVPGHRVGVVADPVRLGQVLGNLLSNASKYTRDGGSIQIALHERDDAVELQVSDDGVGIAPDKLEQVFDLFYQVEPGVGAHQGGLGIGLAMVKRLVELHGGGVGIHSEGPGRGTVVTVRLPRVAPGAGRP